MMVQENSEAISSRPMTPCTIGLACSTSRTIESSCSIGFLGLHVDEIRQRPGTESLRIDAGDADVAFGQQHIAAPDFLREADRHLAFGNRHDGDAQLIVETGGLAVLHLRL